MSKNAKFLCVCESYNFDSSNKIKKCKQNFTNNHDFLHFFMWIADLKVLLRSNMTKTYVQSISGDNLSYNSYCCIITIHLDFLKMEWNIKCWHQMLAVVCNAWYCYRTGHGSISNIFSSAILSTSSDHWKLSLHYFNSYTYHSWVFHYSFSFYWV